MNSISQSEGMLHTCIKPCSIGIRFQINPYRSAVTGSICGRAGHARGADREGGTLGRAAVECRARAIGGTDTVVINDRRALARVGADGEVTWTAQCGRFMIFDRDSEAAGLATSGASHSGRADREVAAGRRRAGFSTRGSVADRSGAFARVRVGRDVARAAQCNRRGEQEEVHVTTVAFDRVTKGELTAR